MKKKNSQLIEIIKYFKKKYLTISRKKKDEKEESNIGSISRTFWLALLIISFFSISPIIIEFAKNTSFVSKDFENNSKNDLKKLLEKKDIESDNVLNHKFLFEDIMMFDEQEAY